jgi:hypothetical protein
MTARQTRYILFNETSVIQRELEKRGLLPEIHLADVGYLDEAWS